MHYLNDIKDDSTFVACNIKQYLIVSLIVTRTFSNCTQINQLHSVRTLRFGNQHAFVDTILFQEHAVLTVMLFTCYLGETSYPLCMSTVEAILITV